MAKKLKSYHIDVGNSTEGHIGLCARVKAHSKQEAIDKLKDALVEELQIANDLNGDDDIEYVNVYLNPEAFKVKDIDDEEDVEEEK